MKRFATIAFCLLGAVAVISIGISSNSRVVGHPVLLDEAVAAAEGGKSAAAASDSQDDLNGALEQQILKEEGIISGKESPSTALHIKAAQAAAAVIALGSEKKQKLCTSAKLLLALAPTEPPLKGQSYSLFQCMAPAFLFCISRAIVHFLRPPSGGLSLSSPGRTEES